MESWVSRWNANREIAHRSSAARELPPGQRLQRGWPVTHYGPVPKFRPERWEFRVFGATADGEKHCWNHEEFTALPFASVVADLHCVTKFSMLGAEWGGVPARTILELAPPAPEVTHVMVWAEYGFSSNLRLADFASERTIFATHKDGELLTAEHGFPLRLVVPASVRLEGPQVGPRRRVHDRRPPRLLGGARLPQHRRPVARAALLVPGGAGDGPEL